MPMRDTARESTPAARRALARSNAERAGETTGGAWPRALTPLIPPLPRLGGGEAGEGLA